MFGGSFATSSAVMMFANAALFSVGGKLVGENELTFSGMFK